MSEIMKNETCLLTFTSNPKWKEIEDEQTYISRQDIDGQGVSPGDNRSDESDKQIRNL